MFKSTEILKVDAISFVFFLVVSTHLVEELPGAGVPDARHPVPASRHNLGMHSIRPDIR